MRSLKLDEQDSLPSPRELEGILLEHPLVSDSAAVSRGDGSRFVYVTLARFLDDDRLGQVTQQLNNLAPLPFDRVIVVSSLPLGDDGVVDDEPLSKVAIIDELGAEELQQRVSRVEGVTGVKVLLRSYRPPTQRLHLHNILPSRPVALQESLQASEAPQSKIKVSEEERPRALSHGPPTTTSADFPKNLIDALERASREFNQHAMVHLLSDRTEERQTFSELIQKAQRVMAGLRAAGLQPGDFVALQLTESRDVLLAFWGCVYAGLIPVIVPVPANYSVATAERDKLVAVQELLGSPVIVTVASSISDLQKLRETEARFKASNVLSIEQLRNVAASGSPHQPSPDDVAFITLSSGSTGVPKAIQLTHKNLLSRAAGTNELAEHQSSDVIVNWLPFDHIGSISDWHIRCVVVGCKMVYCPKERILGEPLEWLRLIERYHATHGWAPNFAYGLVTASAVATEERWDLSSMKSLLSAGEAVSSDTVNEFLTLFADHGLKQSTLRPAFGMAELGSGITYFQSKEDRPAYALSVDRATLDKSLSLVPSNHPQAIGFTCLGPVIAGMSMRIVDAERNVLPEATIGKLHVMGEAVSPGYFHNEEANQVFLSDGWFDTGDEGFIFEGELFLTGRSKDVIIINGANYFPVEIEKAVEEVSGVEVSFSAAYTVRPPGESRECLAVFFVPRQGHELAAVLLAVQQKISQKVGVRPDFLIPLSAAQVPKTGIGKIQRKKLAQAFEEGFFDELLRQTDLILGNERTLPDWFAQPVWRHKKRNSRVQPLTTRAVVVLGGSTLALEQFAGLERESVLHLVESNGPLEFERSCVRVCTSDVDELVTVLERFRSRNPGGLDVFDLRALEQAPVSWTRSEAEVAMRQRTGQLLALLNALGRVQKEGEEFGVWVATQAAQEVNQGDLLCPAQSLLPPLVQSSVVGVDWLRGRSVDFQVGTNVDQALTCLIEEDTVLDVERIIAYRSGKRYVEELQAYPLGEPAIDEIAHHSPRAGQLIAVTGGLGGIGLQLSKRLLESGCHLLLLGRRRLEALPPSSESAQQLAQLRQGGKVHYAAVDVADSVALEAAVGSVEKELGLQLTGVFHLAGGMNDRPTLDEDWDSLTRVLHGKAFGGLAVSQLLDTRSDTFCVYFSSLASRFADMQMGGYAAANRFIEHLARRDRQMGRESYALSWSAWGQLGMNADGVPEAALRALGLMPMSLRQGLDSLFALLAQPAGEVLVGIDKQSPIVQLLLRQNPTNLMRYCVCYETKDNRSVAQLSLTSLQADAEFVPRRRLPRVASGDVDPQLLRSELGGAEHILPENDKERALVEVFKDVLGADVVGVTDSFFDLGGSSLMALKLMGAIASKLGASLPASVLYDSSSVRALAKLLEEPERGVDHLQCLATGKPGHPSLFLIHDADGETILYDQLAQLMGKQGMSVYAFGLNGDAANSVHTRIQAMAAEYVERIRREQAIGPYFVGGLCSGGVLAFEIACQLHALGQEIGLVALFDSADVHARRSDVGAGRKERLLSTFVGGDMSLRSKTAVAIGKIARAATYEASQQGQQVFEHLRFTALRYFRDRALQPPALLRGVSPRTAYHFGMRDYEPRGLNAEVTLFRATRASAYADASVNDTPAIEMYEPSDLGWAARASALEIIDVPGGHSSMLQGPYVKELARLLWQRVSARLSTAQPAAISSQQAS